MEEEKPKYYRLTWFDFFSLFLLEVTIFLFSLKGLRQLNWEEIEPHFGGNLFFFLCFIFSFCFRFMKHFDVVFSFLFPSARKIKQKQKQKYRANSHTRKTKIKKCSFPNEHNFFFLSLFDD